MLFSILMRTSVLLTQGNLFFFSSGQTFFYFLFMFLKQLKTYVSQLEGVLETILPKLRILQMRNSSPETRRDSTGMS